MNKASSQRHDSISFIAGQREHSLYLQEYCKAQEIAKSLKESPICDEDNVRAHRSLHSRFDYKEDCLLCGNTVLTGRKRVANQETSNASTIELKKSMLAICDTRGDEWAEAMRSRLETINDLPAEEATYHRVSSSNFRTGKKHPYSS